MTIESKIKDLELSFSKLQSIDEKYSFIIQQGKSLAPLAEEYKTDSYRIEGCVSKAWLFAHFDQGKVYYVADSEALIIKGIIAILIDIYSGVTPQEVIDHQPEFLQKLGIVDQLSMNRRNGLANVLKQLKLYALAFKTLKK